MVTALKQSAEETTSVLIERIVAHVDSGVVQGGDLDGAAAATKAWLEHERLALRCPAWDALGLRASKDAYYTWNRGVRAKYIGLPAIQEYRAEQHGVAEAPRITAQTGSRIAPNVASTSQFRQGKTRIAPIPIQARTTVMMNTSIPLRGGYKEFKHFTREDCLWYADHHARQRDAEEHKRAGYVRLAERIGEGEVGQVYRFDQEIQAVFAEVA